MAKHKIGIVVFVPLEVAKSRQMMPIDRYEPDDPFCYHCGQKLINIRSSECPGQDPNTRNRSGVDLPDLLLEY